MSKDILVVPDSHAHPDFNNDRFTWLGKLIYDVKPDVVVNIGDLWDFPSLSRHASNKELETKRYKSDLDAGHDAMERINHEIRKHKRKLPRRVFCLGNHDIRPDRLVSENPRLEGSVGLSDLALERHHRWEQIPFLEPIEIEGVSFAHYFTSGIMGRPIGGIHPAYQMAVKGFRSCVGGHSHLLDFKQIRNSGRVVSGLTVGCFFDYTMDYAGPANDMWWRGVVILRNVKNGDYDLETISLERIREAYSES